MGAALLGLSGCSSIVQGTDQNIIVNTNPPGATCKLEREGAEIGAVLTTPGSVTVSKTKHDITITCEREGYQTATYISDSGWESGSGAAGIALDVVLTLGISSAIDSATGADNRYESPVNLTMVPLQAAAAASDDDDDALSDGEWIGQQGEWEISLTIEAGAFTGQLRRQSGSEHAVSGQIRQDDLVEGRVTRKDDDSWGALGGYFPRVMFIQNEELKATFELEKKA